MLRRCELPRREETILSLSPTSIRLAVVRGSTIVRLDKAVLEAGQSEEAWGKELRPLDERLSLLVRTLEVPRGSRVTVLYHAPTTVCEIISVAAAPAAALQAARLSIGESIAGEAAQWILGCEVLHTDPTSAGSVNKTHVTAVAERRDTAEIVTAFCERAGLVVRRQIPGKAAVIDRAVREAVAQSREAKATTLWMSDQSTVICSADRGGLLFARCVEFGYSQLADAILRGVSCVKGAATTGRDWAYGVLFGIGIPQRDQVLDASTGLKAEAVLPGMQSVLQRYVVETRQTLRFMLAEGELARASIGLTGPGAMIPGIAGVLTGQLDLPVSRLGAGPEPESPSVGTEDPRGELALLSEGIERMLAIEAPSRSQRRHQAQLRIALRCGAAAACCLIAGDVLLSLRAKGEVDAREAEIAPMVEEIAAAERTIEETQRMAGVVNTAEALVLGTFGDRTDWHAALGELTRMSDESIRLIDVSGSYPAESKRQPVLVLKGVATTPVTGEGSSSGDALARYIDRLSASPIVQSAQLVSTRSERSDEVKSFVVSVNLRAVRAAVPEVTGPRASAGTEGGQQ